MACLRGLDIVDGVLKPEFCCHRSITLVEPRDFFNLWIERSMAGYELMRENEIIPWPLPGFSPDFLCITRVSRKYCGCARPVELLTGSVEIVGVVFFLVTC